MVALLKIAGLFKHQFARQVEDAQRRAARLGEVETDRRFFGDRVRLVLVELETDARDLDARAAAEGERNLEAVAGAEAVRLRFRSFKIKPEKAIVNCPPATFRSAERFTSNDSPAFTERSSVPKSIVPKVRSSTDWRLFAIASPVRSPIFTPTKSLAEVRLAAFFSGIDGSSGFVMSNE